MTMDTHDGYHIRWPSTDGQVWQALPGVQWLQQQITRTDRALECRERRRERLHQQLSEAARRAVDETSREVEDVTALATYLYWHVPVIPSTWIAELLGVRHPNRLYRVIPPVTVHFSCIKCGPPGERQPQNRDTLARWQREYADVVKRPQPRTWLSAECRTCLDAWEAERNQLSIRQLPEELEAEALEDYTSEPQPDRTPRFLPPLG